MPAARHHAMTQQARQTHPLERVTTTLRHRVSRLVGDTLSVSKTPATHIGAIKFFICHDKLATAVA